MKILKQCIGVAWLLLTGLIPIAVANADQSNQVKKGMEFRHTYVPSTEEILNPARGIYRFRPLTLGSDFASVRGTGASLIYGEIDLTPFKEGTISEERIADIDKSFQKVQQAGLKVIARITYSHAIGEADASTDIIEKHLKQLAPIFEKNKSLIFAVQAGCIGPWGEWHSSVHHADSTQGRAEILTLLNRYIPKNLQIHVRRPWFKQEFLKAQASVPAARFGHHNDCWLASRTDSGTYPEDQVDSLKTFIHDDSKYVAVGGETCSVAPEFTNCKNAVKEFSYLGATYLNGDYHPEVISGFEKSGCWSTIKNSLGYRFEPVAVHMAINAETMNLSGALTVKNSGWAPVYDGYVAVIRVRETGSDQLLAEQVLADFDLHTLTPNSIRDINFSVSIAKHLDLAALEIAVAIVDPAKELQRNPLYAIRLASKDMRWNPISGENILTP